MRLAVEAAPERVAYFFAAWELCGLGWTHTLIPDAVFALKPPISGVFGLEVDCGTEPIKVLVDKMTSYQAGLPNFPPIRGVLFTVESPARLQALSAATRRVIRPLPICSATIGDIRTSGAFAPVFAGLGSESRGSFWELCPALSSRASCRQES